jgi:hypothetical protein
MTMFREGGADSPVSMRRVLAFFYAVFSVVSGFAALLYTVNGWWVFIPSIAFALLSAVLLFFTTWADVALVVEKAKG